MAQDKVKVLIAESEAPIARALGDFLKEHNVETETIFQGEDIKKKVEEFEPHFVVMAMLFGGCPAMELLSFIKTIPKLKAHTKVLVTSSHNSMENVRTVIGAGASDYIIKPYDVQNMVSRLVFHVQTREEEVKKKADKGNERLAAHFFKYTELMIKEVASKKSIHERAFNLTSMLALTVKAVRISLVQTKPENRKIVVRASSDDKNLQHLELDLDKYPEVNYVLNTERQVIMENLAKDPLMKSIKENFESVQFNSMIVVPIFKLGVFYGALSTRFSEEHLKIDENEIRFCQMVGNMLSLLISTEESFNVKSGKEEPEICELSSPEEAS
ncbi:MAG: response regulator [Bdellovibrionales bacterium]